MVEKIRIKEEEEDAQALDWTGQDKIGPEPEMLWLAYGHASRVVRSGLTLLWKATGRFFSYEMGPYDDEKEIGVWCCFSV